MQVSIRIASVMRETHTLCRGCERHTCVEFLLGHPPIIIIIIIIIIVMIRLAFSRATSSYTLSLAHTDIHRTYLREVGENS